MNEKSLSKLVGKRNNENKGRTLVELFRESAAAVPDNLAVVYKDISVTYRELDRMTDRLAAELIRLGVIPGDRVGLLVERNELVPICMFGVLKAGAAYVPLDPGYPVSRLLYMAEDSSLACVVADMNLLGSIEGYDGKVMDARAILRDMAEDADPAILHDPAPGDLMAVLYTSGSTGMPKGVMLHHYNPISYLTYYKNLHKLTPSDAVTAYAGFSFVVHMIDIYPTLMSGATLHIIGDDIRLDTQAVNRYMMDNHVTVAFLPTAFGHAFATREKNTSLRSLTMAGEMFIPIKSMPSDYTVYNAYGSTECASIVSTARVLPGESRITVGSAVDNLELYVVDEGGRLAKLGEKGELCVSGPAVGSGYLNLPEKTAKVFTDNPFCSEPGYERMYHMGDVALINTDGEVEILGRMDFQVKIRGFRVELSEIDTHAKSYPGIDETVTVAIDGKDGEKRLATFVVSGKNVDGRALRKHIGSYVPPYMVPSAVVQIDALPRNTHGKVDRDALPPVTVDREEIVAPRTDTEKAVAHIIADVLQLETTDFGVDTDLMYVGLHSILAIEVMTALHKHFSIDIPAVEILGHPTVEQIARLVEEAGQEQTGNIPVPDDGLYPLTASHRGYYRGWAYDNNIIMDVPMLYKFAPSVDAERLSDAVQKAIDAHPILKAHIVLKDEEPHWARSDDRAIDIPVMQAGAEQLTRHMDTFLHSCNLYEGPLCYGKVCRCDDGVYLFLAIHHIIYDGISRQNLMRDILAAYCGDVLMTEDAGLMEGLRERIRHQGEGLRLAKDYYRKKLAGFDGPTVLTGQEQVAQGKGTAETAYAVVGKKVVDEFCVEHGLTGNDIFLAALAAAVSKFSGKKQVYFTTESTGRDSADVVGAVGLFIRNHALAVDVDEHLSALGLCKEAQNETYNILKHSAMTLRDVAKEYGFAACFNYLFQAGGIFETQYELEGTPAEDLSGELFKRMLHDSAPYYPCDVQIYNFKHPETGESYYNINARYNSSAFSQELIEQFLGTIKEIIKGIIAAPGAKAGELMGSENPEDCGT